MIRRLIRDKRASASVEFVRALPMVLTLLFVGLEAGHFFWTEHKLVKAVRDGARFASRANIEDVCTISSAGVLTNNLTTALRTDIQNLTVHGQILATNQQASTLPPAVYFASCLQATVDRLQLRARPAPRLSPREVETLRWSAVGKTSWEISMILGISERTVNFHLQQAAAKLRVKGRRAACARAVALGLIVI